MKWKRMTIELFNQLSYRLGKKQYKTKTLLLVFKVTNALSSEIVPSSKFLLYFKNVIHCI